MLSAGDLRDYFEVEGNFRVIQRCSRWASELAVPSMLWLRQVFGDPATRASYLLYSRIPVALALGRCSPVPFATDHYRPWPDDVPWMRPVVRGTARRAHSLGFILHSNYAAQSYRRVGVLPEKLLVAHMARIRDGCCRGSTRRRRGRRSSDSAIACCR